MIGNKNIFLLTSLLIGSIGFIFHAWANTIGIESSVTKKGAEALSHGMIRNGMIRMIPMMEASIAMRKMYPNLALAFSIVKVDGANCNKNFENSELIININIIEIMAITNPVV